VVEKRIEDDLLVFRRFRARIGRRGRRIIQYRLPVDAGATGDENRGQRRAANDGGGRHMYDGERHDDSGFR